MKRMAERMLLTGLVVLTGTTGVLPCLAEDVDAARQLNGPHVLKERSVRLNGGDANVLRSGPGDGFAMVGVWPNGTEFRVIAKKDDWYNVHVSSTGTAWIHSSLCEEFDDMSDLEFRPNPRLFSRIGSFSLTGYAGGYAFDRKSNSMVLGGRLGYYVLEFLDVQGSVGWTRITRPAEIVESLFGLALEEEDFHMLSYALNLNLRVLPGRQMVPYLTVGTGSSIMEGLTEGSLNYGAGINFFVKRETAVAFDFRTFRMDTGAAEARRQSTNFEFTVGLTYLF
jgi:hypothetical protein